MKTPMACGRGWYEVVSIFLLLAMTGGASAQESAAELTKEESRCQGVTSTAVGKFGDRAAVCLADCRAALASDPTRRCDPFGFNGFDGKTASCVAVARARAVLQAARPCTGAPCPECYGRAACGSFTDSLLATVEQNIRFASSSVFCTDGPGSLTPTEAACQQGAYRGFGGLYRTIGRCIGKCQRSSSPGTLCFADDQSALPIDAGLVRCVERARLRFLGRCAKACPDLPECFGFGSGCESLYEQVQAAYRSPFGALDDLTCTDRTECGDGFVSGDEQCDVAQSPTGCGGATPICGQQCTCEPVPVCGDGEITGSEACDQSAAANGCFPGFVCRFCSFCSTPFCGDGVVIAPEECEPSISSCGPAKICDNVCTCQPFIDACSAGQVQDLTAGGGVVTGVTAGFNTQSGTCGVSPAPERAFRWTPALSGTAVADVCSPGNFFHAMLYVRQGSCTGSQLLCAEHSAPAECQSNHGARASFQVVAGTTYYIFVDGWSGEQGAFTLRLTPPSGSPSGAFID